ncbi:MAG: DMT family transporter [Patescibacteria group bacterium]|nr:DMT family transporter [Patescibacteria group bacterium]MDD5490406.1 DMT family transporter [Patescibacteria group bacterium]
MLWLWTSFVGYFFNAVSSVINKILLGRSMPNPRIYAFLVGVLGLSGFILAPWGWSLISGYWMLISLVTGACFIIALLLFFTALRKDEASQMVTLVGATQAIIIFVLAFIFLGERLSGWQIAAFLLLVLGGIFISIDPTGRGKSGQSGGVILALSAGIFFALFYILTKYIFNNLSFVDGFIWPRLGSFIAALFLLFDVETRKNLFSGGQEMTAKVYLIFLGGQILGALSFVFINYAISLASVTLVNALQGAQYAFVFILALLLMSRFTNLLKEQMAPRVILQRVIAIVIIGVGIAIINF